MAFPKRLLIEGESLVLDLRPHPIALALPALYTLVLTVAVVWLGAWIGGPGWVWPAVWVVAMLI